jgi:hypothetical protein
LIVNNLLSLSLSLSLQVGHFLALVDLRRLAVTVSFFFSIVFFAGGVVLGGSFVVVVVEEEEELFLSGILPRLAARTIRSSSIGPHTWHEFSKY